MRTQAILLLLFALSACAAPRDDKIDYARAMVQAITADADAEKITWTTWATRTDQYVRYLGGNNPQFEPYYSYRHAVAAEIDARRMTPQSGKYLLQQKLADISERFERDAATRQAMNRPVVCTRVGASVICN